MIGMVAWQRPTKLIALDGEGFTDEDGSHRYVLLCASDGNKLRRVMENPVSYLDTQSCFDFILNLNRSATLIGFSFLYDLNMMIGDAVFEQGNQEAQQQFLADFHHSKWVQWKHYRFRCIPRKMFWLKNTITGESRLIEDVFSFFQMSFIRALTDWKAAGNQPELVNLIAQMKGQRGDLQSEEWDNVRYYCMKECDLLVILYNKLLDAFGNAGKNKAGIPIGLKGNYGPGAAAGYTLDHLRIAQYIKEPPLWVQREYVMRAYIGGRFDLCEAGYHCAVHSYDINSAYPHRTYQLPCLAHGKWRKTGIYEPDAPFAVWRVKWRVPFDYRWPPFPFRTSDGSIYYPTEGSGCYWAAEVKAAINLLARHGRDNYIEVIEGAVFEVGCQCTPFHFIKDMYEIRREMVKPPYDPAERAMKLVYNSLYGKLAQFILNASNKYQCFTWAGMITSGCRAQILDALTLGYHDVLSIATDGILSRRELPLIGDETKQLGEWEHKIKPEVWVIMPGVYWFPDSGAQSRTRGHEAERINWPEVIDHWKAEYLTGGNYAYTSQRFLGAGIASKLSDVSQWRRWPVKEMRVNFQPRRRHFIPLAAPGLVDRSGKAMRHFQRVVDRFEAERVAFWYPTSVVRGTDFGNAISFPYSKGRENAAHYHVDETEAAEQPD